MTTRYFGAPIRRNEDARLLRGQALFVDDVEFPGMLHAAFLRSNLAHARIRSIDVSAARAREGVVAVYTAEDLGAYWAPGPLLVPPPPIEGPRLQPAHAGAARQRQGAPRRRALGGRAGAEPLSRRGCSCRHRRRARSPAGDRRPGKGRRRDLGLACTKTYAAISPRTCVRAAAITPPPAPAPITSSRAASATITARRRRSRRAASLPIGMRAANQLTVWDTTQGPVFLRNGLAAHARPQRAAGARHCAVRRRRLRPRRSCCSIRRRW